MAWLQRFPNRGDDRGYARDFHYRGPLERGREPSNARRRGERFFVGYDRGDYRRTQRPYPPRDRGAIGYGREYSSGLGYDPYYDERFERGEHDFSRRNRQLRQYDRAFRGRPRGYDRYF